MENNELLKAIGQMMDERFEAERNHTAQMIEEKLAASNDVLRQEMATKKDISEVKAVIENSYQRIENLLREDYSRVEQNAAKGAEAAESYKEVRSKQNDHARAIKQHHERITVLEEKAI